MKRRDFLIKGSIATSAAVAAPSIINAMHLGSIKPSICIGVVGTGSRGNGMISLMNTIDGFSVKGCCDVLPFRLEEGLKSAEGKAKGYGDYRKMLDNKAIDAVLISSTFNTHSQIAIDALDAGKHVYCEKTMGKGIEETLLMREKALSADQLIFQTGHQYHSSRLYTHIVDLIQNGKIGKVMAFECQWNQSGDWRRPVPSPEFEKAVNWRMYRQYSGGLTAELCSHHIDFANWVLGRTPKKIMGLGSADLWNDGRETFDNVHLLYDYGDGVTAKFTCLTGNGKDGYQIKVLGSKGTIIIGPKNAWFYPEGKSIEKTVGDVDGVSGATKTWIEGKGFPIEVSHTDPSKQALEDFRDNIYNKTMPITNAKTGAHTAIAVQMSIDAMMNESIEHWKEEYN